MSGLHNLQAEYWLTLFYSLIFSAAAIANHYNVAFSLHQVLITAGLVEAVLNDKFAQYFYT